MFQNEHSQASFLKSIPKYIKDEVSESFVGSKKRDRSDSISDHEESTITKEKLQTIMEAIIEELQLYEYLKNLKKEKNQNKRMP